MNLIAAMLLLSASCIYEDPHNHAGGVPLEGTYSVSENEVAVSGDFRPTTTADGTGDAWDVRTATWVVLDGWTLLNPSGLLLLLLR